MWDWVGGCFLLWSVIGLLIVLYLGFEVFEEILEGVFEIDEYFKNVEFENNVLLLMVFLSVWNMSFLGYMV